MSDITTRIKNIIDQTKLKLSSLEAGLVELEAFSIPEVAIHKNTCRLYRFEVDVDVHYAPPVRIWSIDIIAGSRYIVTVAEIKSDYIEYSAKTRIFYSKKD